MKDSNEERERGHYWLWCGVGAGWVAGLWGGRDNPTWCLSGAVGWDEVREIGARIVAHPEEVVKVGESPVTQEDGGGPSRGWIFIHTGDCIALYVGLRESVTTLKHGSSPCEIGGMEILGGIREAGGGVFTPWVMVPGFDGGSNFRAADESTPLSGGFYTSHQRRVEKMVVHFIDHKDAAGWVKTKGAR